MAARPKIVLRPSRSREWNDQNAEQASTAGGVRHDHNDCQLQVIDVSEHQECSVLPFTSTASSSKSLHIKKASTHGAARHHSDDNQLEIINYHEHQEHFPDPFTSIESPSQGRYTGSLQKAPRNVAGAAAEPSSRDSEQGTSVSKTSDGSTHAASSSKKQKVPKKQRTPKEQKAVVARRDVETWKYRSGLEGNLPPLSNIHDIVDDMVDKFLAPLQGLLQHLNGHTLQVATLCSGTESPILFLTELAAALKERDLTLRFKHVFSAEIEPFKQAYIENNFHPPILFRDITQFGIDEEPETAYGTRAKIPTNIDLIIAGFSCVDFSNLNSHKKTLDDNGQSGTTARAVLKCAQDAKVPIVVLENISSAPWKRLEQLWNEGGYEAMHVKVDTKDYYIPHTRQRGYMICISTNLGLTSREALAILKDWKTYMKKFKRPASSPFYDFLLDPDNPQLQTALAEYDIRSQNTSNTSWVRYKARHLCYRELNLYGSGKPITEWRPNGSSSMIEHGKLEWMRNQVDRVKDTFDISVMRCERRGYDMHSKCTVTDFSQGVDRQTDTTPFGLVPCITPSGIPYSTIRGGLITGIEALRLQGIPTDELSLTRESQKELHNMAGNAMSTTVVGAAIISSLLAAMKTLPQGSGANEASSPPSGPESHPVPPDDVGIQLFDQTISSCAIEPTSVEFLINLATITTAQCLCEGATKFENRDVLVCKSCNYVSCKNCRGKPLHNFMNSRLSPRLNPSTFKAKIIRALPMCALLTDFLQGLSLANIIEPSLIRFLDTVQNSMQEELRFSEIKRSHRLWTVMYKSSVARLELKMSPSSCEWLYYAFPIKTWPGNSKERKFLEHPVGHMTVKGKHLFEGQWKFRWPITRPLNITLTQSDNVRRVPAWRARMKLPEFLSDRIPLEVSVSTNGELTKIDGKYTYLPECGTARAFLYSRSSATGSPMYFFLDPEFYGDPKEDRFVFSPNPQRIVPGQTRFVVASVGQEDVITWLLSTVNHQAFEGTIDQRWLKTGAMLMPVEENVPIKTLTQNFGPLQDLSYISADSCTDIFTPVFVCTVPGVETQRGAWRLGPWLEVTDAWQHNVFTSTAWLTSRCADLGGIFQKRRFLTLRGPSSGCKTCAPKPPQLKWKPVGSGYQPYENPEDAVAYEAAIKSRPKGIVAFTKLDPQGQGHLLLGLHLTNMAHRAVVSVLSASGQSESGASPLIRFHQEQLEISWVLDRGYSTDIDMPQTPFALKNNQDDPEMCHTFKNAIIGRSKDGTRNSQPPTLRQEQARSLHWMVNQESPNAQPFIEEETEEAFLRHPGWLLSVRATWERRVLGGVIADGVGYGKTITTLALIEVQKAASPVIATKGRIPLKATLILVTAGTLPQWESEARNFLGESANITVIKDTSTLKKSTVAAFKSADIIIAPHALFTSAPYLDRYAQFAAVPTAPTGSRSRAYAAWTKLANQRTAQHIADLNAPQFPHSFGNELHERRQNAESDNNLHESVPSKGQVSGQAIGEASRSMAGGHDRSERISKKRQVDENQQKPRSSGKKSDPFELNTAESLDDIQGPVLEMFEFHRIVIDEFTYLTSKDRVSINALCSLRKWILSGTPPLEDFSDIKRMANALGIHLGSDDVDKRTMSARNVREMQKEQTGFEKFREYANPHTRKWYRRRSKVAQNFVSQYVRKNFPTYKMPPSITILKIVNLGLVERASYTEIEWSLIEKDMHAERIRKTKYMGDRETRVHDALQAKSGELGLLGAAMYLMPEASNTFVGTRDDFDLVLNVRNGHLSELNKAMTSVLFVTVGLHEKCKIKAAHYENWKESLGSDKFEDKEAGEEIFKLQPTIPDPGPDLNTLIPKATKYLSHVIECDTDDLASRFSPTQYINRPASKRQKVIEQKLKESDSQQKAVTLLRELTAFLSVLTSQYIAAFRAIRYFNAIGFLNSVGGKTIRLDCGHYVPCCIGQILTACGHTACPNCVDAKTKDFASEAISAHDRSTSTNGNAATDVADPGVFDDDDDDYKVPSCIVAGCNAHMSDVRPVSNLLVDDSKESKVKNFKGSKISEVVHLIKDVIPDTDQVIVFVQEDRMMQKIGDALKDAGVSNFSITESIARSAMAGTRIKRFREGQGKMWIKALLLNSTNESCAGSNLQNAHHVVFVAPLHATSGYDYNASETQCLGRASRKGQKKDVLLYRFLALNTIDVDILEARTAKKVVKVDDVESKDHGKWMLKEKERLTEGELIQDWGTIIGKDFLPERLNEGGQFNE